MSTTRRALGLAIVSLLASSSALGQVCPLGTFDGANCYVMTKPPGGFIYNNSFYATPSGRVSCPLGSFDGANCLIASAPWPTTAFAYGGNWYTTPCQPRRHVKLQALDGSADPRAEVEAADAYGSTTQTDENGIACVALEAGVWNVVEVGPVELEVLAPRDDVPCDDQEVTYTATW